jgi:peptidoglycan DL-endopeptidase LytF
MNNPSPLVPQGSILEQKNSNRARVRLAVFFVLSVHVIALMALLMQGCRKPSEPGAEPGTNAAPAFETTLTPAAETNVPGTNVTGMMPSEPAPITAAPAAHEYTVAKGDSFYTVAKKFGVTIKAIEAANPGVEPTKLQIGQKLQIPAPPSASTTEPALTTPGALEMTHSGEQVYTVKSGDTLTKIATQFGTTIKALRSQNNLETDKIKVGQKLKIPSIGSSSAAPAAPAPTPAAPASSNP